MKKLLLIPAVLLLLVLCATPALADDPPDPPDTSIDITVVTPGDVEADIGINAGGDVDLNISGYPWHSHPPSGTPGYGAISAADYWRYWGEYVVPIIAQLQATSSVTALTVDAVAKLIEEHELTATQIEELITELDTLDGEIGSNFDTIMLLVRQEDDRLNDMIINGAEAHIEANRLSLQNHADTLSYSLDRVNSLQGQVDNLRQFDVEQETWAMGELNRLHHKLTLYANYALAFGIFVLVCLVAVVACLIIRLSRRSV